MIALDLVALWRSLPPDVIHAVIAEAMARAYMTPEQPSTLASAIAAMVRSSSDDDIAGLVGPEILRRLGGDARAPLAATWEQACDAARAEAQQARRSATEWQARAEDLARGIEALNNRHAEQRRLRAAAEADRDAICAIGWEAIVDRDITRRFADRFQHVADESVALAYKRRRALWRARSINHARVRLLVAALRAARAALVAHARVEPLADTERALATIELRDVPAIVDNHCPGECGQLVSECACDVAAAELLAIAAPLAPPGAGAFASVFSMAPAPPSSSRRVPALPSRGAIPGPSSSRPDVAPFALRAPLRPAPLPLPVLAPLRATTPAPPAFRLVVLPIADITALGEHFACSPLRATITASSCLSRQRAADPVARKLLSPGERVATGGAGAYGACKACPDGQRIAAQLSGKPAQRKRGRAAGGSDVSATTAERAARLTTNDMVRSRRHRLVRASTIDMTRVTRRAILIARAENPGANVRRLPMVRGACASIERPCPYVSCQHHLYLDVDGATGSIKLNFPDLEVDELEHSCALDVALGTGDPATGQGGGNTLEEIAKILNLTRERVRQIEVSALAKLEGLRGRVLRDFAAEGPVVVRGPVVVAEDEDEDEDEDDEQAEAAE